MPNSMGSLQVSRVAASGRTGASDPLATIPTGWFPQGDYRRDFSAYLGGVWVPGAGGEAHIQRSRDSISVSAKGLDFSLEPVPGKPGQVLADTPQGQFTGRLTRRGDQVTFRTADDSRSVTMEAASSWSSGKYVEISTRGFGLDSGSITVPR